MNSSILIVDDDPSGRLTLETILEGQGYTLQMAEDGPSALSQAEALRPDLVLLDVMMPKKSGYEVCAAMRADAALAGTKIIMLTAKGRDTEVAKGLAMGADAYVTKPFSTKDLVAQVRTMLEL